MALKNITNKLDNVTYDDLGIQFDEGLVWEKLESRLDHKTKAFPIQWMVAAALFLGVFFIPFTLIKENQSLVPVENISSIKNEILLSGEKGDALASSEQSSSTVSTVMRAQNVYLVSPQSKSIELEVAQIVTPEFSKVEVLSFEQEKIRPQFAVEDISVIQANLENASVNDQRIERGRKMAIRAQWQSSSNNEATVESNQSLKIRLLESRTKRKE